MGNHNSFMFNVLKRNSTGACICQKLYMWHLWQSYNLTNSLIIYLPINFAIRKAKEHIFLTFVMETLGP